MKRNWTLFLNSHAAPSPQPSPPMGAREKMGVSVRFEK